MTTGQTESSSNLSFNLSSNLSPKLGPKLSIIVLVYNVEPYIERCMDSILEQGFGDFEVILVIEKRSTDASAAICAKYANSDNRIQLCYEDGTGFPAARNRGLDEASGEFVTFIDADDYILPGMFGAMYERARGQSLDILCCGAKKDLGDQDIGHMCDFVKFGDELFVVTPKNQRDYMYKFAIYGRTISVWGKFYKRGFLEKEQLRFHPEAYGDDSVFSYICFAAARRVATMQDQFYIYYDRPGSRTYSPDYRDIERNAEIVWSLYLSYAGSSADNIWALAATRLVTWLLGVLKLKPLPIEKICEVTWGMIQKLGLPPHLRRACDTVKFNDYAKAVGMSESATENYRLFIESLQSYDSMLAWQMRYKKIEENVGKWNMAK